MRHNRGSGEHRFALPGSSSPDELDCAGAWARDV